MNKEQWTRIYARWRQGEGNVYLTSEDMHDIDHALGLTTPLETIEHDLGAPGATKSLWIALRTARMHRVPILVSTTANGTITAQGRPEWRVWDNPTETEVAEWVARHVHERY